MKKTTLTVEDAIRLGTELPYAYITRLSEVTVGPTPDVFGTGELLEARFFGPDREVRIFRCEDDLCAVMLEDEAGDVYLDKTSRIRRSCFGKTLTLRRYLSFDEDGQAYIAETRLLDWEGVA